MTPTSPENASDSLAHALTKVSTGRTVLAIILGILSFYVYQVIVMAPLLPVLATNEYLGLFLATVLYNALVIASTWAIIRFLLKQRPGVYGLGGPVLCLRWAVAAFIVPAACVGLITLAVPGGWQAPGTGREPVDVVVGLIIYTGMFGSIVEEIVFHGLMYPLMKKWLSPWWSAVVTGVVFAVAHMTRGGWTPLSAACFMFTATALAIYFAYVVEDSGSVWSAAWGHIVWNIALSITNISTTRSDIMLFNYVVKDDNVLLTGGSGGFGDSLITALVVLACAGLLAWRARRRESQGQVLAH